jgi:hypothetical protein
LDFIDNTIPLSGCVVDLYHQKAEYQKEHYSALADNVDSINRSHFVFSRSNIHQFCSLFYIIFM